MKINKLLFGFEEGRRALMSGIMQVNSLNSNQIRLMFRRMAPTDGKLERNMRWELASSQWIILKHLIKDRESPVMRSERCELFLSHLP